MDAKKLIVRSLLVILSRFKVSQPHEIDFIERLSEVIKNEVKNEQ